MTDIRFGYYHYDINTSKYDQGVPFAENLGIPGHEYLQFLHERRTCIPD